MRLRGIGRPVGPAALLAGLLLTGCADGGGSAAPSPSAPPAAAAEPEQKAYTDCMTAAGVAMTTTVEGNAVADKAKSAPEALAKAEEQCAKARPSATPRTAAALEQAKADTRCMREHGVAAFPDPDPVSGQHVIDEDLLRRLKADTPEHAAHTACFGPRSDGEPAF